MKVPGTFRSRVTIHQYLSFRMKKLLDCHNSCLCLCPRPYTTCFSFQWLVIIISKCQERVLMAGLTATNKMVAMCWKPPYSLTMPLCIQTQRELLLFGVKRLQQCPLTWRQAVEANFSLTLFYLTSYSFSLLVWCQSARNLHGAQCC